jgi:hypothetical protein
MVGPQPAVSASACQPSQTVLEFEQLLGEFIQAAREHIRYEETQA